MRKVEEFLKEMKIKMDGDLAEIGGMNTVAENASDPAQGEKYERMAEKMGRESLGRLWVLMKVGELLMSDMNERGAMMELCKEWEEKIKRVVAVEVSM